MIDGKAENVFAHVPRPKRAISVERQRARAIGVQTAF